MPNVRKNNKNKKCFINKFIKKACNRSWLVYYSGYRQVTLYNNKHRTAHAIYGMNLLTACPRCTKIGGIRIVENKS